jgi:hypothetical protein
MEDTMTTLRTRSRVSLAALTLSMSLAGCAGTTSRLSHLEARPLDGPSLPGSVEGSAVAEAPAAVSIQFDNQGDNAVRVYLVDAKRQWLLGRVERGANASLRIPRAALTDGSGWMRLAIAPGDAAAVRGGESRAPMATEPVAVIVAQRWTYSRSLAGDQLTSLPLVRATAVPK